MLYDGESVNSPATFIPGFSHLVLLLILHVPRVLSLYGLAASELNVATLFGLPNLISGTFYYTRTKKKVFYYTDVYISAMNSCQQEFFQTRRNVEKSTKVMMSQHL